MAKGAVMGKIQSNKMQKRTSLLNTAFNLFITKGVNKTTIAEISEAAGIAKGTFYLYFKDKYDIKNKLVSHKSGILFENAAAALDRHVLETNNELDFEDQMIFIVNYIIDTLSRDKSLLMFIAKNLSWGIFKEALYSKAEGKDTDFHAQFNDMILKSGYNIDEPEIMLFLITELVSSTCYSTILYSEPTDIKSIKPYLFKTIRSIIDNHKTN